MSKLFSIWLRPGLLAAGLVSCMMAPVAAGAMPMPQLQAPPSAVTQVRDADRPGTPASDLWLLRRQHGNWARGNDRWDGRRQWNNDNRNWRRDSWRSRDNPRWRDDSWRDRRHYRGGSGFYFGLGVVPSYNYYVAPRYVAPRRSYRAASSAHVRWCYDRYRSYRAWDNTYQPYNGPRRQCYSPYD
jgi:hypothetical protein